MDSHSYLSLGVSSGKGDVKQAVSKQDAGLFPGSFCKIVEDLAADPAYCSVIHADGAGTKSAAAYLMYRETGDRSWFRGIAQDSTVMNTDDLLCVGATGPFLLSNTIGRNAHRIDAACLSEVIAGYQAFIDLLNGLGVSIAMTGGETADVGDLVQTLICDSTIVTRLPRDQVISAADIKPDQVIVGLSSTGQTTYEARENSGISSNGLTAARHLLLAPYYAGHYPETYAGTIDPRQVYQGRHRLEDNLPGSQLSVGEALLSPTRTYLPILAQILPELRTEISGIIHCTGGGQVKCRDFGQGIRYVKDNLFARPAIFEAIVESGGIKAEEAYQVFNLGHRLEIVCSEAAASRIIASCASFNLEAKKIGYTERLTGKNTGKNEVIISDRGRTFEFR